MTMDKHPDVNYVYMEPIYPHFDDCCICDCEVQIYTFQPNYGIPMYEDLPVPVEWEGEWGGFAACKSCFDKYEAGQLKMWTVEELEWVTRPSRPLLPRIEPRK